MATHFVERLRYFSRFASAIVERALASITTVAATPAATLSPTFEVPRGDRVTLVERLRERMLRSSAHARTHTAETRVTIVRSAQPPLTRGMSARPACVETRFAYPPVPRSVVRSGASPPSAKSRAEARLAEATDPAESRAPTRFAPPPGTPAPVTLQATELTRVTEFVIGELDRRVLSYRERTGKL
jgi:hypothetical protein